MYVARVFFDPEGADFKAFESFVAARDFLRIHWTAQQVAAGMRFFRAIKSIAVFDVDMSNPADAIQRVQQGDSKGVRIVYLKDANWIEDERWALTGTKPLVAIF
jgi:hypothetical protein